MRKQYLFLSNLHIHNANAMSSSYTIGFPAITGWLGAVHALERNLNANGFPDLCLKKTAISCSECSVQWYRGQGDYRWSICGTANPLKKKGSGFERPPFVEEPRCDLRANLLIEMFGYQDEYREELLQCVAKQLARLKIAGGDIVNEIDSSCLKILFLDPEKETDRRKMNYALRPGFVIRSRRGLLLNYQAGDSLDGLLSAMKVICHLEKDANGKVVPSQYEKYKSDGWLVPIVVGFKDISGQCKVDNQRTYEYEHHFVEPIATIGEFVLPYRCESVSEFMWSYRYDAENGLYLCKAEDPVE